MNTIVPAQVSVPWKSLLRWSASFAGFPLAGVAARAAAGNIDDAQAAVIGGLAAGAVLGAVQAVALPGPTKRRAAWAAATTAGVAGGLALGAGVVDFKTDTASLVVMGAITGGRWARRRPWSQTWRCLDGRRGRCSHRRCGRWDGSITSQVIVDADRQHAMFGSSGAVVVAILSGLLLTVQTAKSSSTANATPVVENAAVLS